MNSPRSFLVVLALTAVAALAVETKTWVQSDAADFEKGTVKGLALSSDGHISLGPAFAEIYDPAQPQLWAAASDSKGAVFVAGTGGKIFAVDAAGKGRAFAEIPSGEIYSLAVSRKDELFAAVSPDAKVYRISAAGKVDLVCSLDAKFVWSLVFDSAGNLYAGTGDQGKIFRITADGKAALFFETDETHARSLAIDPEGNVIAGTEPGGLVIRVSPKGEGFVLFQTPKREITALLVSKSGEIYAAASGQKPPAVPHAPAPAVPVPQPQPATGAAPAPQGAVSPIPVRAASPLPMFGGLPSIPGGSEVYRIPAAGAPRRIWGHDQHIIYALAFDAAGKVVVATGNQGYIYRIDSDVVSTRLIDSASSQITALVPAPHGALYAISANVGKVFRMGPGIEKQGTLESDLLDAGSYTEWGRLRLESQLNGGAVKVETRSGNLDRAHNNWSPWAAPNSEGRIVSPAARFLGWRATLTAAPDGASPVLSLVEAAYRARNLAPVIERIEMTPPNHKFPSSSISLTPSGAITLPPIGQPKRSQPGAPSTDGGGSLTMSYERGELGARWRASDMNGDTLEYKVEIRGTGEREWKLLKDHLRDSRISFDSTGFADGEYRLRISATDLPDNVESEALSAQMESDAFLIDNTPPEILNLTARVEGSKIRVTWEARDALSPISSAEYTLNGGEWQPAIPTTRLTDSLAHQYSILIDKGSGSEFTIAVRMSDDRDNETVRKTVVR